MNPENDSTALPGHLGPWRTVPALVDALNSGAERPSFTDAAIRNYLAFRQDNGLARYCRKIGQKVLISEPGFNAWVEQHETPNP